MDPLRIYREKRDFSRTPEPGAKVKEGPGFQFVVQKHAARRLHYDLRLELDGVLKSWAVTRGPSLVAGEKRLAVHTEDHPMQYLEFEGVIPQGEYGGGTMIVWDRGTWFPENDPHKGLAKGRLDFALDGARLKGRWHLVRMRPRPHEKKEQWLLLKGDDEFARTPEEPDVLEETRSFLSGKTNEELAAEGVIRDDHAARQARASSASVTPPEVKPAKAPKARKGLLPLFLEPSLASLVEQPPSGSEWIHEIKYDGYRMQARLDGGRVQLLTRKGLDWTARFGRIAEAVQNLSLGSALLDGEIVSEGENGVPSFSGLQADLKAGRQERMVYYVFDVLYLDGVDLTRTPQIERKRLLEAALAGLPEGTPLRYSAHFEHDGGSMLTHACRLGLEGVVSKRKDAPYVPDRGSHWLKAKCVLRQEFVVIGYTVSTAAKRSIGSLTLGYYEDGKLIYAGRSGTGFSGDESQSLFAGLSAIASDKPQLGRKPPQGSDKGVRWVEPRFVAEIEFRGWTTDGLLRQSSFKGLREDKPPTEVVREGGSGREDPKPVDATALAGVRLTHPERILWEDQGVTKQGLADFYADIADWALPHFVRRPLSLVRCPNGVGQQCFFQKHRWEGLSPDIHPVDVGDSEPMTYIEDLRGLMGLVQAGVLEIHPWGSSIEDIEKPDRLIFDLDPGEDVAWGQVIDGALEIRRRLGDDGLESFVKTSGGKGLHVVAPLEPAADWETAKDYTRRLVAAMERDTPSLYVSTMAKRVRKGRIFVDYLRNGRGATAVAAYSTRARAGAPVSTPLAWTELSEAVRGDHFRIDNLRQRLDFLANDPWEGFFSLRQRLPGAKAVRRGRSIKRS
ncbi:DNA ligase D [Alsobacter soli]|uniref:DNA ligase (ATP) n=1 Tax=Alsobacter soli TaxID=2109933 RepID=A0A2T1HXW1_9HYPH|nr:DNA ligase D [Alsobacter soli]PSC06526.1 DNA ligase D [Alsobacter soli]